MARYRGAKLKVIRRLGYLPGLTGTIRRTSTRFGNQGRTAKKLKQYGIRLKEKQKLRFNYGISEKQLVNYITRAKKIRGATGNILLQLLEMRLDNIIFRLGIAPTIAAARQLVTHKHILINNSCVSIPSYSCKPGDQISIKKSSIPNTLSLKNLRKIPKNLKLNKKSLSAIVCGIIDRDWSALKLNDLFVVEYYSRKI